MDTEKIETQARREAAHIIARCPYLPGTPERAMWLDATANAVRAAFPGGTLVAGAGPTVEETAAAVAPLDGAEADQGPLR